MRKRRPTVSSGIRWLRWLLLLSVVAGAVVLVFLVRSDPGVGLRRRPLEPRICPGAARKFRPGPAVASEKDIKEISNLNLSSAIRTVDLSWLSSLVSESTRPPIFFLETDPRLRSFPAAPSECAFESAAAHNPLRTVVVVLDARSRMDGFSRHLLPLRKNLIFVKTDFEALTNATPAVEGLWRSRLVSDGNKFRLNHISDVLRAALLYSLGGAYLDSDVVSVGEFPGGGDDFVVAEGSDDDEGGDGHGDAPNNDVMSFRKGSKFLRRVLEEQGRRLGRPEDYWGMMGPAVLEEVTGKRCNSPPRKNSRPWWGPTWWPRRTRSGQDQGREVSCRYHDHDVVVKGAPAAHPIRYYEWRSFFRPEHREEVLGRIDAATFAVHLWNGMWRWSSFRERSATPLCPDTAVYALFQENCPRTEAARLRPSVGKPFRVEMH